MRMRRKPCHNGLAQLAKVIRDGDHFGAGDPGVDEQHAGPALHDNGVALYELALVDQYTLRDLPQHVAPSACGLQSLVGTVVPGGSRVQAVWAKRMSRGRGARSTPPSSCSAIAGACSSSATSSSETAAISESCKPAQKRGSPRTFSPTDSSDSSSWVCSPARTRDPASGRAT